MSTAEGATDGVDALIHDDGRIARTAARLLTTLGFGPNDDLRGLHLASFWHHSERPALQEALRRARRGEEARIALDLSYVADRDGCYTVALSSADGSGAVRMTVVETRLAG